MAISLVIDIRAYWCLVYMARWHAEHYMMRVEQRMQVSDIP